MIDNLTLNHQLIEAIQAHAEANAIEMLLQKGASANNSEVTEILEEAFDSASPGWIASVLALHPISLAMSLRKAADQAAFDLISALEENDFANVEAALYQMAEAGDDANIDMGDGSMLAVAVENRCKVKIISSLITLGNADPTGFSKDAFEALEQADNGTWKIRVGAILRGSSTSE